MQKTLLFSLAMIVLLGSVMAEISDMVLARVEWNTHAQSLPIYAHMMAANRQEYVLTITTIAELDKVRAEYQILHYTNQSRGNERYYIALERIPQARLIAQDFVFVLNDDGRNIVFCGTEEQAEKLAEMGFEINWLDAPIVQQEAPVVSASQASIFSADVADMIAKVNETTLKNYVGNLSGEWPVSIGGSNYTILSRNTKSGEPIQKATQYCSEFLQKCGMTVSYHEWSSWSSNGRNVIGTKLGTKNPKEIILITGHLDSMPSGSPSPGADDNGSGSAGVLLTAEILGTYSWERTLRFVLFTGEEQGLLGSKAYATKVAQDGDTIVAVYNMDMIAWDSKPGMTLRLHTRSTSSSGYNADKAIVDIFANINTTYQLGLSPILDADGIQYSDHASFWNKGYPGILAIEDDVDDFCANYHTSRDKLSTLNMNYFTRYVKATVGTIAILGKPVQK